MCVNPNYLNGNEIPCHVCWQCKTQKVNDWVGRCLAEQKTTPYGCWRVTLTYGDSNNYYGEHEKNLNARLLNYQHVQNYLKILRQRGKDGSPTRVRFMCAGEYGSMKGRAHFHMILFWYSKPDLTNVVFDQACHTDPRWPHGFTYFEKVAENDFAGFRYVCKYLMKDEVDDEKSKSLLRISTKPPLGAAWFKHSLARRYVDAGLTPKDGEYSFPEVLNKKGKPAKFYLGRRSAEYFRNSFIGLWRQKYCDDSWPHTDYIDSHMDDLARMALIGQPIDERKWKAQRQETTALNAMNSNGGKVAVWPKEVHDVQKEIPSQEVSGYRRLKEA